MQLKSTLLIHIALLPVYITVASFFGIIPQSYNLASLFKLARTNLPRLFNQPNLSANLTTATANATMSNGMKFVGRPSDERGNADHDWLKTFHTFSFAMYQDWNHEAFGPLRVINEDRVAPRTGFGTHSHREFEIFSYVVKGELEHKDSMGNTEILRRGDLQLTSAGTGISHSEKCHGGKEVHFLQIWSLPATARLQPKYFTRHFSDEEKKDTWARIVAPAWEEGVKNVRETDGPAPVQSALSLYATLLSTGKTLERPFEGKKGYIHVVQTSGYNPNKSQGATVKVSGPGYEELELKEGDGAYIFVGQKGNALKVENTGDKTAEVLLFDLE
ncbi:RmlC-like cupin [Macrolepiota fuliginosa MF-IS2]|uniref:RmlC-like cupin n=1 Tax=Macrolepiota fuliginosa MF-IS2 TaxID=1400762 RepID=A0A9P5XGW2_9AGAR|nr:RmlC-like cupin [Macrolepiota fuliginosa MF-IS2]